jgi:tetratricopeptide (TPR) repeat protein
MKMTISQKLWHEAWQCIADERPGRARERLDRLRASDHVIPEEELLQLQAAILGQEGSHAEALALLEPAAERFPDDYHIPFTIAWNLAKLQNWTEAIAEYRRGLSLPGIPEEDRSAAEEVIEQCEKQLRSQQRS